MYLPSCIGCVVNVGKGVGSEGCVVGIGEGAASAGCVVSVGEGVGRVSCVVGMEERVGSGSRMKSSVSGSNMKKSSCVKLDMITASSGVGTTPFVV